MRASCPRAPPEFFRMEKDLSSYLHAIQVWLATSRALLVTLSATEGLPVLKRKHTVTRALVKYVMSFLSSKCHDAPSALLNRLLPRTMVMR